MKSGNGFADIFKNLLGACLRLIVLLLSFICKVAAMILEGTSELLHKLSSK